MSLLDSLLSGLAGTSAGANSPVANPLVNIASQMLTNRGTSGGLSSLIEQFQRAGLGPQMDSWISTGQTLPISPDQLRQVFGRPQQGKCGGGPQCERGSKPRTPSIDL